MGIPVKLEMFEGPLDLLLHLIEKNKIDIYDIPIVEITRQYMEYIHAMPKEDLGTMSEFMVMAATLLDIKCRMLLPAKAADEDGEETDPRQELVEQLLQYKMYKYMSYELKDLMDEAGGVFYRKMNLPREVLSYREPVDPAELVSGLTLEKLNKVYRTLMKRREDRIDPIRSRFGRIEKETVSVSEKMLQIRDYAVSHRKFDFMALLEMGGDEPDRTTVVVTFLCILELMKMGHIQVTQELLFDEIKVEVRTEPSTWKRLTEFDKGE